jgi:mRNA interferase YafQ
MSKSRTIQKTSKFKKDFKQYQANKKVVSRLNDILYCLMNRLPLSEQYKNHPLTGEWKGYYDCHVLPNVVLIYTYDDTTVSLTRIGTHNKLGLTESKQSNLKLHINESMKKYPPCPIKAKKNSYRSKTVTKICDDGLELTFEVLPNRTTAVEFIYWLLDLYEFPWAKSDYKLKEYNEDEEWYIEDMQRYEDGTFLEPDTSTYIEFEDMSHIWIEEEPLIKNAIKAYRSAYKVEELIRNTGYDCTLYGGYIYYDEYYGDWNASLNRDEIDDFDNRKWKVIGKTWVEER